MVIPVAVDADLPARVLRATPQLVFNTYFGPARRKDQARARAADARGACRREAPLTLVMPDGLLVEGIADLAFEEQGRWIVVDYKTDREIESVGEERYRRQVALYAAAIARATGQPATAMLVRL